MEFINELKSPQDIPEVVGVDWAASDRVLLACQDGGIRIMGLGLSGNRMDLVLIACQDGGIGIMGLGLSGNRMDLVLIACQNDSIRIMLWPRIQMELVCLIAKGFSVNF